MTADDYITQALQVLTTSVRPPDDVLTAAAFGQLLRQANPQKSWKDFHYSSFKRFLEALEQRGHLTLVETDKKALAVKPQATSASSNATSLTLANSYNPLRKAVWAAFVFPVPEGKRFLHVRRGDVRMGLSQSPTPIDEWVEIMPIDEASQKHWALEFANGNQAAEQALLHPQWHSEFPKALALIQPRMRADWNRLRSERVSEHVKQWAIKCGVSHDLLFEQDLASAHQKKAPIEGVDSIALGDLNRQAILAAVNSLPTSELLRLWLPAGVLLDAVLAHSKRQDV